MVQVEQAAINNTMEEKGKTPKSESQEEEVEKKIEECIDILEEKVEKYGELAIECAPAFFEYGLALFEKAKLENDVFGEPVQKAMVEKAIHKLKQETEGESKVEDLEQEDDEEDLEENDMELAWRNLETARVLFSKAEGYETQLAEAYSALAELSLEREDFDNSISDFKSAINIMETIKDKQRLVAEYCYKLCLAFQMAGQLKDGLLYCKKSIDILDGELAKAEKEKESDPTQVEELKGVIVELNLKMEELSEGISRSQANGSTKLSAPSSSSQLGFDKPVLGSNANASAGKSSISNLGVAGRGVHRVSLQPLHPNSKPSADAQVNKKQKL